MSESIFCHPHRVAYADCTVGNHIYHSRYLDILEIARGEFFRSLGLTLLHLQEADAIFPIVESRLRFKAPARYDDLLAIEVWPFFAEKIRINFAHRIRNQHQALILEGETFHVCTGLDDKPKRLPPELLAKVRPQLRPGTEPVTL